MFKVNQNILTEGVVLKSRYEIKSCLQKGPFLSLYEATDLERKEPCTIRELFPLDATRNHDFFIYSQELSKEEYFRLGHLFIGDANEYSRLSIPQFFSTRDIFCEQGTRYHVVASLEHKKCLTDLWDNLPNLSLELRLNISKQFFQLLELFEKWNFIHFQLTPKNIYFEGQFSQLMVMPGTRAQLWYSDRTKKHHHILESFFTHPNCLNRDRYRSSECDIYSVWKIFLHLFPEKYLGKHIPQKIKELSQIFESNISDNKKDVPKSSIPKKFECPACNDLLEIIIPLKKGACPVCREGILQHRKFDLNACAKCKKGILHTHSNSSRLQYCPVCQVGKLSYNKYHFKIKMHTMLCVNCHESFLNENNQITRLFNRKQESLEYWLKKSNRGKVTHECDSCQSQFDEEKEFWKFISSHQDSNQKLLPQEWARLASNVDVGAGNTFCNYCHANFDIIHNSITPIQSPYYSSQFFDHYRFQYLDLQKIKWFGMNKHSSCTGLICRGCHTEFDTVNKNSWKLVWTQHNHLKKFINEVHSLEKWHSLSS